jgi:hypothetical protein
MTIYIVSMSTTQGPYGPTVNMTYHRDHQEALDEFTECTKSLTEDPSTILLVKVDGETMENTILNSFEGTDEDYMDEYDDDDLPPEGYAGEDEEDEEG